MDLSWADKTLDDDSSLSANARLIRACITGNLVQMKKMIALGAPVSRLDTLHRTPLMYAARFGRRQLVEYLCAQKVDVNTKRNNPNLYWQNQRPPYLDIEGGSALMDCAMQGDIGIARILLENGADVNATSALGNTALFYAAQEGNRDMVAFLLGKSADVNKVNLFHESALSYAVHGNQTEVVNLLLKNKRRPNKFVMAGAIYAAADSNNVNLATRLLKTGIPCDTFFFDIIHGSKTPLLYASRLGRLEIVKLLLENPANLKRFENQESALCQAASGGHPDLVRYLLANGAETKITSEYMQAFSRGIENGNVEVVELFLKHGVADQDLKILFAYSNPFDFKPEVFRVLLPRISDSSNANAPDSVLKSLAYRAVRAHTFGRISCVENLAIVMRLGVEFDFDSLGITPLMAHAASGDVEAMKKDIGEDNPRNMFREVNLNKVGPGGLTALGYANLARKLDAVKLLVENGVEVNLGGLLVRAFEMGDIGFIDYLLEKGAQMPLKSVSEPPFYDYYNSSSFPNKRSYTMQKMPLLLALELGGYFERFFALEAKRDSSLTLLDYQSAFFIASTRDYQDVAKYLLKHHPELGETLFTAGIGEKLSLGVEAFIQAAQFGHTSILKLMVDSVRPPEDWAPVLSKALLYAERYGNRKSTEFILEQAYGVGRGIR